MGTKIINTCTAPDGTVFKRTSTSGRKYAFAVIGYVKAQNAYVDVCWNSRRDLAEARRSSSAGYYDGLTVVPVTVEEKVTKEKPVIDFPAGDTLTAGGLEFKRKDNYTFRASYKDRVVEVYRTGRTMFKAVAYFEDKGWDGRLHTDGGSPHLDNVVKRITEKIDAAKEIT